MEAMNYLGLFIKGFNKQCNKALEVVLTLGMGGELLNWKKFQLIDVIVLA